jgi:hypothetical protein
MHTFTYSTINNTNLGLEELNKEYKEIYLNNISNSFTDKELDIFMNNNKINKSKFNKLIFNTINSYIMNYLPKYIGVFLNSNISGNLYFGINDIGNIIGIPFFGKLDESSISQTIYETKKFIRSNYSSKFIDNILANIQIEICEINNTSTNKNNYIKNLNDFQKINDEIKIEWIDYLIKYQEWHKEISKYSAKLSTFLESESIRQEIAQWVRLHKTKIQFKKYDLENIAKIYENNIFINRTISFDFLDLIRHDYSHPIKWLIDFKDYKQIEIKKNKPTQPTIKPLKEYNFKFCSNIDNISYLLNRLKCKFYVLKFTIPLFSKFENLHIEYFSEKKSKWVSKSRILTKSGPGCS